MNVTGINPTSSSSEQSTLPQPLGKEEFLKLLVAQLAHQDPMNPLEDKEFVAQLAQFSSLEQMMQTNERLSLLQVSQSALANAQIASLIGQEVVVQGDQLHLTENEVPPDVSLRLDGPADNVTIRIKDDQGRVVRTLEPGQLDSGLHAITWDGRSDSGEVLPGGSYRVEVEATDSEGGPVRVDTQISGVVTAVTFENGYPELLIGEMRERPADVIEVRGATTVSNGEQP